MGPQKTGLNNELVSLLSQIIEQNGYMGTQNRGLNSELVLILRWSLSEVLLYIRFLHQRGEFDVNPLSQKIFLGKKHAKNVRSATKIWDIYEKRENLNVYMEENTLFNRKK